MRGDGGVPIGVSGALHELLAKSSICTSWCRPPAASTPPVTASWPRTLAKAALARAAGWFVRRCAKTCISPRLSALASWPAGLKDPEGAPDTVLVPCSW